MRRFNQVLTGLIFAIFVFSFEAAAQDLTVEQRAELRDELRKDLQVEVEKDNTHLSDIGVRVCELAGEYSLWVTHPSFRAFKFERSRVKMKQLELWISQHREKLAQAQITEVGYYSAGQSSHSCWFEFKGNPVERREHVKIGYMLSPLK